VSHGNLSASLSESPVIWLPADHNAFILTKLTALCQLLTASLTASLAAPSPLSSPGLDI
jgi:hypothetical protein